MLDKIFWEDCRITLTRPELQMDYIFMGPPDFEELEMDPGKDTNRYYEFLTNVLSLCMKKCELITISFTDRKYEGRIIEKNAEIYHFMKSNNYLPVSHKIWDKSGENLKINLYRLNYLHMITYSNKKKVRRNKTKEFMYDVFRFRDKSYWGFSYGMPTNIVEKHILEYTRPKDIVYDPFMGSGTTAEACIWNDRHYIGSEIDSKLTKLTDYRLKSYLLGGN